MQVGSNWKLIWEPEAKTDLVWNTECMLAQTKSSNSVGTKRRINYVKTYFHYYVSRVGEFVGITI